MDTSTDFQTFPFPSCAGVGQGCEGHPTGASTVIAVRGRSRTGKTSLCERLIPALGEQGLRVGYIKRTHHLLDLPAKSSGRIWAHSPAAMLIRAPDRVQVTFPPAPDAAEVLVSLVPPGVDIVLLETHSAESYPTLLWSGLAPEPGEHVIGAWEASTMDRDLGQFVAAVLDLLPKDRHLDDRLARARRLHGGGLCPGLALGTRLALHASNELGVPFPHPSRGLKVVSETDRCALDALQSATGCSIGNRALLLRLSGRFAATFHERESGRAVRVAARSGLRELAADAFRELDGRAAQVRFYREAPAAELFESTAARFESELFERRPRQAGHLVCRACGEEVSGPEFLAAPDVPVCRACHPCGDPPAPAR
jgi:formylmethanofuran dehydrogenase subunit E